MWDAGESESSAAKCVDTVIARFAYVNRLNDMQTIKIYEKYNIVSFNIIHYCFPEVIKK